MYRREWEKSKDELNKRNEELIQRVREMEVIKRKLQAEAKVMDSIIKSKFKQKQQQKFDVFFK
jgi:chaperonin cofactor prefoldin